MSLSSSKIIAAVPGLTYRQLHHWTMLGHVQPIEREKESSGVPLWYADREVLVLRWMVRLLDSGLTLSTAARIARRAVESGTRAPFPLSDFVDLVLHD